MAQTGPAPDESTPIPLTVWTTHADDTDAFPDAIADRVLTTYSKPGDLICTTSTMPANTADRCAATGRRHRTVDTRPDADIPAWILTDRRRGAAALALHLHRGETTRAALGEAFSTLAALLQPGGFLLVVLPDFPLDVDPLTDSVNAARTAGLLYIQHLLTIRLPVPESLLANSPGSDWDPADDPTLPTPQPPLRIHSDLAVFTRPTKSAGSGHPKVVQPELNWWSGASAGPDARLRGDSEGPVS